MSRQLMCLERGLSGEPPNHHDVSRRHPREELSESWQASVAFRKSYSFGLSGNMVLCGSVRRCSAARFLTALPGCNAMLTVFVGLPEHLSGVLMSVGARGLLPTCAGSSKVRGCRMSYVAIGGAACRACLQATGHR